MRIGAPKWFLAVVGMLLFLFGLIGGCGTAGMDTAVTDTDSGRQIHNIGLIGKQQALGSLCAAAAVSGAVLVGAAAVIEAMQDLREP